MNGIAHQQDLCYNVIKESEVCDGSRLHNNNEDMLGARLAEE